MDLCGHATLAAAHVIFNYYEPVKKFKHFLIISMTPESHKVTTGGEDDSPEI